MMKTKALFISCVLLCSITSLSAQSKFHVALDYHYNLGLSERFIGQTLSRSDYKMHGNSLHLTALYNFSPKITAGVGIGADRYDEPGYNTFPVYATVHYYPTKRLPKAYLFTDLGYGMFGNDNINSGVMWNLGLGYKKMFCKHFGLNFQFGYNLKQFGGIEIYEADLTTGDYNYIGKKSSIRHSLSFGVGLVF